MALNSFQEKGEETRKSIEIFRKRKVVTCWIESLEKNYVSTKIKFHSAETRICVTFDPRARTDQNG